MTVPISDSEIRHYVFMHPRSTVKSYAMHLIHEEHNDLVSYFITNTVSFYTNSIIIFNFYHVKFKKEVVTGLRILLAEYG